jgi:predicted O-methyltransferase YrrM
MLNIKEINELYSSNITYYNELEKKIKERIDGRICHHRVLILDILRKLMNIEIYLEIGVHNGTSMSYALQGNNHVKAIGIDLFESTINLYKKDNLKMNRTRDNILKSNNNESDVIFIKGDSRHISTIKKLEEQLDGNEIDLFFIDGDHTYNGVKNDFDNYVNLVKKGGLIVFDDYGSKLWIEITKFVNDNIKNNPKYRIVGHFLGNELIVEKLF